MWVFEIILEFIGDCLLWFSPRDSIWYWLVIAMILCVIVGTIVFLSF